MQPSSELTDCIYNIQRWIDAKPFFHSNEIRPFFPQGVTDTAQQSIFGITEQQSPQKKAAQWRAHITTPEALTRLIDTLSHASLIALDTETRSLTPFRDGIVGVLVQRG